MKYDIKDIINIYNLNGLIALRDYIEIHGSKIYDAATLKDFIIILINVLINLDLYHLNNGSIYTEFKEVLKEYEKI